MPAYDFPVETAKGQKDTGLFEGMMPGFVALRKIAHLCPDAPLADDF